MKTILEFNLPEEGEYLYKHLNGPKLLSVIRDIDETWRHIAKHSDDEGNVDKAIWARSFLNNTLEAEGIDLYE